MSVVKYLIAVGVLVGSTGCSRQIDGEDSWVVGFYSMIRGDIGEPDVWKMNYTEFFEDGTVERTQLGACGGTGVNDLGSFRWEMSSADLVVVSPPEGEAEIDPGTGITAWHVRPAAACQQIEISLVRGEEVMHGTDTWTRGRACLVEVSGGRDPACKTAWCEGGEPPACD